VLALLLGRPGLAPGIYFRLLMVGYFEGVDSGRGIARRAAVSLSIRSFVGSRSMKRCRITPPFRAHGGR